MPDPAEPNGKMPMRIIESETKRRCPDSSQVEVVSTPASSSNKRLKIESREPYTAYDNLSRPAVHSLCQEVDQESKSKTDFILDARQQAMDDILRSISSEMTNNNFRDVATKQLLELAIGHDLDMLPGETLLVQSRDRLRNNGMIRQEDLEDAWIRIQKCYADQCDLWTGMAGSQEPRTASASVAIDEGTKTPTPTDSPALLTSSEDSSDTGSDSDTTDDDDDDFSEDETDGSEDDSDSGSDESEASSQAQPRGVEWKQDAPRILHAVNGDGEHIIASGCSRGQHLFNAAVIDMLPGAGIHVQQASQRNDKRLERKLKQMYEPLEKSVKDRWGRLNSKRKNDERQRLPCAEFRELVEQMQLQQKVHRLAKHFTSVAA